MGFLGNKKGGIRCEPSPDGSLKCRTFEVEGNEKVTSGTDVSFNVDPNTCEVNYTGSMDLVDGDEERLNKVARALKKQCQHGLGSRS